MKSKKKMMMMMKEYEKEVYKNNETKKIGCEKVKQILTTIEKERV
jgi:hypothetical protein